MTHVYLRKNGPLFVGALSNDVDSTTTQSSPFTKRLLEIFSTGTFSLERNHEKPPLGK